MGLNLYAFKIMLHVVCAILPQSMYITQLYACTCTQYMPIHVHVYEKQATLYIDC